MSDAAASSALPPLADGTPSGPDLEYDNRFNEMQIAAKGKPEGQFGNPPEPAKPPDWRLTGSLAEELLGETRDLRVMSFLAVSRLHTAGLPGFAGGLRMLREAVDELWDDVHPKLDPEDDNDPSTRANGLLMLTNQVGVLRPLRDAPLASVGRARPVTYRDLLILAGALEAEPGREKMSETEVRDTFIKAEAAQVAAVRTAVGGALADLAGLGAAFDAKGGPGSAPDLGALQKLLGEVDREVRRYEALATEARDAGLEDGGAAGGMDEGAAEGGADAGTGAAAGPVRVVRATIRSISTVGNREEALHALALASSYFVANEPSSPLPLLIDRAIRLAPLPFLDILRDMAPDGLMQAQGIAGTVPE